MLTVLSAPRHPLVAQALRQARQWCAGQVIDDRPAFAHAVTVAVTLGRHVADPAPDLVAATLLHDAPELAPPDIDLDLVLSRRFSAEVLRIVRALDIEHHALDRATPIIVEDLPVLLASTVDKIVALGSLLRRAAACGDVDRFFTARPGLLQLLPHFRACCDAGVGRVPASMSAQLDQVLENLTQATAALRASAG